MTQYICGNPNFYVDGDSCTVKCPPNFTYVQDAAGTNGTCVHDKFKNKTISIRRLPKVEFPAGSTEADIPRLTQSVQDIYNAEMQRLNFEGARVMEEIAVEEARPASTSDVKDYDKDQANHAAYTEGITKEIKEVKDSLKPFRPPTSPSSDLEKERQSITKDAKKNLFFLQLALFLILLVLLSYVILPLEYANPIAFLLLCLGIAVGFFLKG